MSTAEAFFPATCVTGVDGCRDGWIGVDLDDGSSVTVRAAASLDDLLAGTAAQQVALSILAHDRRPHPQRNSQRPAHPHRHRGQRSDPAQPHRRHRRRSRRRRRGARDGDGLRGRIAYSWDSKLDGLSGLSSVPTTNLLIILNGMPLGRLLAAVRVGQARCGSPPGL